MPGGRAAGGEPSARVTDVTTDRDGGGRVEFAQRAMLIVGIGLLVAALLLILNTIRMAMFARRREIEVMKLVGATNWFIRVPFMLEGIVQGIVGAGLALGAVFGLDRFMQSAAENEDYGRSCRASCLVGRADGRPSWYAAGHRHRCGRLRWSPQPLPQG